MHSSYKIMIALTFILAACLGTKPAAGQQSEFSARHGSTRGVRVEPGQPEDAIAYYQRIEKGDVDTDNDGDVDGDDNSELNLNLVTDDAEGAPEATLDDVLEYLGYRDSTSTGVTADRIERFGSDALESFEEFKTAVTADGGDAATVKTFADGDMLATRYFAPKITDVARERQFFQYGWRKLVRLKSLDGSEAKTRGVLSAYFLFNVFATEAHLKLTSPFDDPQSTGAPNRSQQNQLIFVRDAASPNKLDDTVYWLVFGELPTGTLEFALGASFDYRHPKVTLLRPTADKYFVPDACADCHGDLNVSKGKLNYLDTDHWFDRVTGVPISGFNDDFGAVGETAHGVILDGGKNQSSSEFKVAFDRIKKLNVEIRDQNKVVDALREAAGDNFDPFPTRSVEKWLEIHEINVGHVGILDDLDRDGILDRAIAGDDGAPGANSLWRKNDRIDEGLLPLMNRYCYRCHSSLRYSIYDRSRVRFLSKDARFPNGALRLMQKYLTDPTESLEFPFVPFMPQDRPMILGNGPSDRDTMVELLDRMID